MRYKKTVRLILISVIIVGSVETQEEILKPVTVRDKDDIKYIGGEIDVYKLERNKNEIKFINNNESYHLNDDPF